MPLIRHNRKIQFITNACPADVSAMTDCGDQTPRFMQFQNGLLPSNHRSTQCHQRDALLFVTILRKLFHPVRLLIDMSQIQLLDPDVLFTPSHENHQRNQNPSICAPRKADYPHHRPLTVLRTSGDASNKKNRHVQLHLYVRS